MDITGISRLLDPAHFEVARESERATAIVYAKYLKHSNDKKIKQRHDY